MSVNESRTSSLERRSLKRSRQRTSSSQTDEDALTEDCSHNGCSLCSTKLQQIEEKLDKVLLLLPEFEQQKKKIAQLEESLQFTQTEVKQLQETVKTTSAQLNEAKKKLASLSELERRQIKQECYTRRSNIKFFGIKDNDEESPSDTEETLRHFLTKEMKIPRGDVDKIEFQRVHRIPTKPSTEKKPNPRPIIAKVSFYQDKELIKSHIKNLKKGSKLGVADDYPKEVEQIRKDLQPALKKARQEKKLAFFNVEKLIIDGRIYRGPETKRFPFYGRLMESGISTV